MSQSEPSKSITAGLENDSIAKPQDKSLMNININMIGDLKEEINLFLKESMKTQTSSGRNCIKLFKT